MSSDATNYNALVASMAQGNERAAATLYDDLSPTLYALALRILGERADAEEVVLESFTQAWKNAAWFEPGRSSVLSWLSMITRTRSLDLLRSRSRRSRALSNATHAMGDEPVAVSGTMRAASDLVEDEERAAVVGYALHSISAAQRIAIELSFFSGLTHLEIAERLGEPLGTVKTRIRLGMQHMRSALERFSSISTPGHVVLT